MFFDFLHAKIYNFCVSRSKGENPEDIALTLNLRLQKEGKMRHQYGLCFPQKHHPGQIIRGRVIQGTLPDISTVLEHNDPIRRLKQFL